MDKMLRLNPLKESYTARVQKYLNMRINVRENVRKLRHKIRKLPNYPELLLRAQIVLELKSPVCYQNAGAEEIMRIARIDLVDFFARKSEKKELAYFENAFDFITSQNMDYQGLEESVKPWYNEQKKLMQHVGEVLEATATVLWLEDTHGSIVNASHMVHNVNWAFETAMTRLKVVMAMSKKD